MSGDASMKALPSDGAVVLVVGRDLAAIANREHEAAVGAAVAALDHAMAAGDALLEIRRQIPAGDWMAWVAENLVFERTTATNYMRLATYREHVVASGRTASISDALAWLRGQNLPAVRPAGGVNRLDIPDEILDEMRRLRDEGVAWRAIARRFGLTKQVVQRRLSPAHAATFDRSRAKVRAKAGATRAAQASTKTATTLASIRATSRESADAFELLSRAVALLDGIVITDDAIRSARLREAVVAIRKAMRLITQTDPIQTNPGFVLRCADCPTEATSVASLVTHVRMRHGRIATREERTPAMSSRNRQDGAT